jgi:hypothetical protein
MKTIRSWMSHHPFKVVLFTFLFTLIPAIMAVTNERLFYPGLAAFMFFVIVWAICVWRYSKNIVTMLTTATFLVSLIPAKAEDPKPAAPIAVGVVIICVGGFCVYKIVKVCQKVFPPKDTNAPPEELSAASDEYGGAMEYSSIGSCWVPPDFTAASDQQSTPITFALNVLVEPEGSTATMSANKQEGTTQTWAEYQSDMAAHGLFLTGHGAYRPQFELGGIPCEHGMVPLEFDPLTGRVSQITGSELHRVVVERSPNLTDWYPLLVTDVGVGTGFKVVDTTVGFSQMFYRVQVTQP